MLIIFDTKRKITDFLLHNANYGNLCFVRIFVPTLAAAVGLRSNFH